MGAGDRWRGQAWLAIAVVSAVIGGAVLVPSASAERGRTASIPPSAGRAAVADVVELLPLWTVDRRIVDSAGRDVILRGANVNSLGEYWQGVPSLDPTLPVTDADWDEMAARGFSVIRLLITWSRVEPTRGVIDEDHLAEIDAYVRAAADRGIYSVIDMHQDAYSAAISTADPAECPPGTSPAKGWDGAPAWATLTDGLSTCLTTGERNSSPAVNRAWNNFYDDVDGIRTRFAASWAAVASYFAGRPEVAGFDLLNEPEAPRPADEFTAVYNAFIAQVVTAIRGAQAGAPFEHLIFVEPALPAGDPANGLVIPDPATAGIAVDGIVGSVHNYAESISIPGLDVTIEALNDLIETLTAGLGVAHWGGEYGFWDRSPETLAKARRYAADEDDHLWGGAWWQWRQSCGDPHSVRWEGDEVVSFDGIEQHLNLLGCPGNTDLGPNEEFLQVLGRGYPRAAPGRLDEIRSDPDTGYLKVKATAPVAGGELVVWTPTVADGSPERAVNVFGLTDVREHAVPGGRLLTATVAEAGTYALWVGEPDEDLASDPDATPPAPPPGSPAPAVPIAGRPDYTG